jgi:hypothetical protein
MLYLYADRQYAVCHLKALYGDCRYAEYLCTDCYGANGSAGITID